MPDLPFSVIEVPLTNDRDGEAGSSCWFFEVFTLKSDANKSDNTGVNTAQSDTIEATHQARAPAGGPPACFVSAAAMRDVLRAKMGGPLPEAAEAYFNDRLKTQETACQNDRKRSRTPAAWNRRRPPMSSAAAVDSAMLMVLRRFGDFSIEKRYEILKRYFDHLKRRTVASRRRSVYDAWTQLLEKCGRLATSTAASPREGLRRLLPGLADFYGLKSGKAEAFLSQSAKNVRPLSLCNLRSDSDDECDLAANRDSLANNTPNLGAVLAEKNLAALAEVVLSKALFLQQKGGVALHDPTDVSNRDLQDAGLKALAQTLAVLPPAWLCRDPMLLQQELAVAPQCSTAIADKPNGISHT